MQVEHNHSISLDKIITDLSSDRENGLTFSVVAEHIQEYGYNKIDVAKEKGPLLIFLSQFHNLMTYLLLFASGLSFWFDERLDAIAILMVILINSLVGFWMEMKARISMSALKNLASIPAKVFREGKLVEIPGEEVVPGDVLYVESGDMITADARVFNPTQLTVNEASLTGEALSVEKLETDLPAETPIADRRNMVFKGTFVATGNTKALVVATGMKTELGKIAGLVQSSDQEATPLEEKLQTFSRTLIYITIALVYIISICKNTDCENYGNQGNSDVDEDRKSVV